MSSPDRIELLDQPDAQRLLAAALAEGPAHAYLFHGPTGVGKRDAAVQFAGELIGDPGRVARRAHPDLYVVEPVGDQIRIDDIRTMRRDLHLRPFEAQRRVYLVFSAESMNEDAADALLKDLEEPPGYAVIVLVANELGPLPETIRSRCQLVPFRRLSQRAIRELVSERAGDLELTPNEITALARVARGRLDRAERLLDPAGAERRARVLAVARSAYGDGFVPREAAEQVLAGVADRGREARTAAEADLERLDLTTREADQRLRRAQRGAEREELLLSLEELAGWYRDLVAVAAGAAGVAVHADHLAELEVDASTERARGAAAAAELVLEAWRAFEEFNVQAPLALEALFIRLHHALAGERIPV
jgi:DNA polymerase III subunit delta'